MTNNLTYYEFSHDHVTAQRAAVELSRRYGGPNRHWRAKRYPYCRKDRGFPLGCGHGSEHACRATWRWGLVERWRYPDKPELGYFGGAFTLAESVRGMLA